MNRRMFSNAQLRRLIIPLLVEQLLVVLVGMIDTMMVSSVGEAAISGVSIVNDVNNLIVRLLAAAAGGGSVVVSQYLGHGDREESNRSAGQLIVLTFVISMAAGLFCLLFHRVILNLLYGSVEMDVMAAARTYFWITALSFPFLGIYNGSAALFRCMSETKFTMYVSILMNFINVAGNYICIYKLGMGVAGAAWPTLISRAAAAVFMFSLAFSEDRNLTLYWKNILHWDSSILRKIIRIAIPNGVENGLFQFGKIMISSIVTTYGTSQIAANGVSNSLTTLGYTTEGAMQLAIVTVIGQCVGANDYDQAKYYMRKMIRIAWVLTTVNNLLVFLAAPYALKMYTLTPETASLAMTILTMECLAITLLHPPAFVLPCGLRASGDAKYTMYVGVISMFIARVGCAYLLGTVFHLGIVGTRMGMYIDWCVRIVFFVMRYRSGRWMNYRVIG